MSKSIKPVMVEWIDSMGTSGWRGHQDSDLSCRSVGILHKKGKDRIVLALNQGAYGRGDYMEIPMCAVKRIVKLKVKK